jgi:hypothetical protein
MDRGYNASQTEYMISFDSKIRITINGRRMDNTASDIWI